MEDYSQHITEAVRLIEDFYPEYLEKTRMEDSLLSRAMFYGMMIEMTMTAPTYPYRTEVVDILNNRRALAHDGLKSSIHRDPQ